MATTTIIPVHTPALKIPAIASQLLKSMESDKSITRKDNLIFMLFFLCASVIALMME